MAYCWAQRMPPQRPLLLQSELLGLLSQRASHVDGVVDGRCCDAEKADSGDDRSRDETDVRFVAADPAGGPVSFVDYLTVMTDVTACCDDHFLHDVVEYVSEPRNGSHMRF